MSDRVQPEPFDKKSKNTDSQEAQIAALQVSDDTVLSQAQYGHTKCPVHRKHANFKVKDCYCATGASELQASIGVANTKIPQVESVLKEALQRRKRSFQRLNVLVTVVLSLRL